MHVLAVPLFRDVTDGLGPPSLLAAIFFIFFYSTIRVLLRALTCSKTLENSHTRWNPLASGRHRGWDPGVAQGLYSAP